MLRRKSVKNIGAVDLKKGKKAKICPYYPCGFIKKYETEMELVVTGMMNVYCKGAKMIECKRKVTRDQTGRFPSDDYMPNGTKLVKS